MDSLCRICSQSSSSFSSIFTANSGRLILDIITAICPIKIEISDSLPHQICSNYLDVIIAAYDLRVKSVESDTNFRKSLEHQLPGEEIIKQESDQVEAPVRLEEAAHYSENDFNGNGEEEEVEYYSIVNYEPDEPPGKYARLTFKCDICHETFVTQNLLNQHVKASHYYSSVPKPQRHFKSAVCPYCKLIIQYHFNLPRHIKTYHNMNLPFKCSHCTYRFPTEGKLHAHEVKEHKKEEEEKFECDDCDETFDDVGNFINHVEAVHKGKKEIKKESLK